ncbi:FAD-dependent monooxygenase [Streptomyces solisilvae]|uniref:FAD-dependent monooxygenase n=1 Tax=Streptomyces malaysiensis TaxID=92644 RepID=UPI0036BAAC1F
MVTEVDTPVLIVGGGPVGLALALELGWRGVRSTLVEQGPGTETERRAKANGLHERTMEMCRRWGIVDRVAEVGFPPDHAGDTVYATALHGYPIGRTVIPSANDRKPPDSTPEKRQRCPQYEFDPLLARVVMELGHTTVRYNSRLDEVDQDADGVTARITDLDGGTTTVRARYLVACDGAGSVVRRSLDIPFEGRMLDFSLSAVLTVPEMRVPDELAGGERYILISPDGAWCVFTSVDGRTVWRITIVGSQERLDSASFDMAGAVRRALGRDDVPFHIDQVLPWRRSQCSAATYRVGRILLAGDAAHTTSPTGGHGLNTGIGDVSDLGWMLDALLAGWGGDRLLDAYDLERRPVAMRNSASATANYQGWVDNSGYADVLEPGLVGEECRRRAGERLTSTLHSEWSSLGVDLGYRYEGSPIIVADGTPAPADHPSEYIPTSRPGHRAPHAWLADGRSTLDLFGRGFVLLRFGECDVSGLETAAAAVGLPLMVVDIAEPDVAKVYERTLVLVRPDGQVAWRGDMLADPVHLVDVIRGVTP